MDSAPVWTRQTASEYTHGCLVQNTGSSKCTIVTSFIVLSRRLKSSGLAEATKLPQPCEETKLGQLTITEKR